MRARLSDAVRAWRTPQPEVDMLAAALGWWLGSLRFLVIWIAALRRAHVAGGEGRSFLAHS
jgi:hypothetical protein